MNPSWLFGHYSELFIESGKNDFVECLIIKFQVIVKIYLLDDFPRVGFRLISL